MSWIVQNLWLIPALPIVAAGIIALAKQPQRKLAASLAIGSMVIAFVLSVIAFLHVLHDWATAMAKLPKRSPTSTGFNSATSG